MIIGDRAHLDAERKAILDQFDTAWLQPRSVWDNRALHAASCAQRFAEANRDGFTPCWIIFPGGRVTAPRVILA